ncbi:MAG: glycosyltransferase, partial [Candidatus Methylumidiphilus sp.]
NHGLPVVSSRTPGALELIEEGVTGLLAPIQEPAALAGRLWEIFSAKPAQRTEMGHAGRHFLNTHFGQAAIVGDYLNLYGQLLAKAGA